MRTTARSRRHDILDAARREFLTAGYSGARIERIAAAAEVNKQLLFHYFASKEGLFAAALAQLLEQLEARHGSALAQDSPVAQIRQLLRELVVAVRAAPGVAGILADARANPDFPRAAAGLLASWRERLAARLAGAIRAGQQRGYFRDDVDPAGISQVAVAAAVGAVAVDPVANPPFEDVLPALMVDHCAWR